MMNMMTDTRFEELAGIYGSKIAWWPEAEQASAEALLAQSEAAQAVLEAERALDTALDGWDAPAPSQALMARILGDAAEISAAQQASEPVAPRAAAEKPGFFARVFGDLGWRPAGAMTACLAIGFMAGMSGAPAPMDDAQDVAAVAEEDNAVMTAFFGDDTDSDPFDLEIL